MKNEGYPQQVFEKSVKRYVQTMDLKPDSALIEAYKERHSEGSVWKEILAGIRKVGILEMEIYILGTRLVMIVEAPVDFDWDAAMSRLATLPRQQEWEAYMSEFQQCGKDETSDEKWKMMERMFHLYK